MAKLKFFDVKNVVRGIKGLGSDLVTGLIVALPIALIRWLYVVKQMMFLPMVVLIATILFYLNVKGYWYKKFWSWG